MNLASADFGGSNSVGRLAAEGGKGVGTCLNELGEEREHLYGLS